MIRLTCSGTEDQEECFSNKEEADRRMVLHSVLLKFQYFTRERFIPIHNIASKLGQNISVLIPLVHAPTGCDSTNSLFGIGKITAYTVVGKMANSVASGLGFSSDGSSTVWIAAVRSLVLAMYGNKGRKCKTLDEVRYALTTTTDKSATQLPPTEDASKEHA